jgi:anti-sigma regulatory factor (Ser/Thr protein kinase)
MVRGDPGKEAARAADCRNGLLDAVQPIEDAIKLRFDGGAQAAVDGRRALTRLRSDLDPPLLESLRLLITELISNAVRHAGAPGIDLLVVVGQPAVRVEVADRGPGFDSPRGNGERGTEGGWGLLLVERLADRWGVARDGARTRVWFELERRA